MHAHELDVAHGLRVDIAAAPGDEQRRRARPPPFQFVGRDPGEVRRVLEEVSGHDRRAVAGVREDDGDGTTVRRVDGEDGDVGIGRSVSDSGSSGDWPRRRPGRVPMTIAPARARPAPGRSPRAPARAGRPRKRARPWPLPRSSCGRSRVTGFPEGPAHYACGWPPGGLDRHSARTAAARPDGFDRASEGGKPRMSALDEDGPPVPPRPRGRVPASRVRTRLLRPSGAGRRRADSRAPRA